MDIEKSKIVEEFTDETIGYLNETDIDYRKATGQYFTPRTVREHLISKLPKNIYKPRILDPGCGTGEFLKSVKEYCSDSELHGWDIDSKLIGIAKTLLPDAQLMVTDALLENYTEYYDIVIGNPPYYEFHPDSRTKRTFKNIVGGRTNIFGLFIELGLRLLKDGGYLAFVVPPSMDNGAYFRKIRRYIVDNANIEYLTILDNTNLFHLAQQMTMLIILRKGINKGDYIFEHNGISIFSENQKFLKQAFKGKTTLYELGFTIRTGRLVWNENKELLTDNPKEGIPLIWAHNITDKGLELPKEHKRPQYVRTKQFDIGPAIVVNRITGAARSAKLRAALVPENMKFIAENHVNVIFPPSRETQLTLEFTGSPKSERMGLESIIEQLCSSEKLKVMQNITGNTQISKTELERLLPINRP